jgi:hypothetical protein
VIRHERITVGTNPTLLTGSDTGSQAGSRLLIRNNSATASVFLGDSSVTSDTGWEFVLGDTLMLTLDPEEELYAVAAIGTVVVAVLRIGV